jgi:hypothetical protein
VARLGEVPDGEFEAALAERRVEQLKLPTHAVLNFRCCGPRFARIPRAIGPRDLQHSCDMSLYMQPYQSLNL